MSSSKTTFNRTSFFNDVFEVVSLVPYGRVTTYGAIATYLGTGKSSRMVGWAMNYSHLAQIAIPAHRVVNRVGLLSGKHHFTGNFTMAELLQQEGIEVVNDQVKKFKQLFWNPSQELSI